MAKESPNMEVNGVADNEDDSEGAGGEAGGAAVAVVSHDGLDEHAGDWAAEPDEGGPSVGNPQQLDVRGK